MIELNITRCIRLKEFSKNNLLNGGEEKQTDNKGASSGDHSQEKRPEARENRN